MITDGTIMIAKNGLNSSKTVITAYGTGDKYSIADDAVVYKYDTGDKKYTVAKLSSLKAGNTVTLYDTKGDDANGIASVVIFIDTDLPN
ncbi:hypothetical protein SDC9_149837 [bioreactor metagenome]|uniref:Uncharacterized protein n=1 Tax=bioreactor metagenome TaxID=1076179 RepID=A0A645EKV0_9ZZZZ